MPRPAGRTVLFPLLLACAALPGGGCRSRPPAWAAPSVGAAVPADFVAHAHPSGLPRIKAPPAWARRPPWRPAVVYLADDAAGVRCELAIVGGDPADGPRQVMPDEVMDQVAKEDPNLAVTRRAEDLVMVSGHPARRAVADWTVDGKAYRELRVDLQKKNRVYVLSFIAPPRAFDANYRLFEQVVASLDVP